jgi:DNA-binding LacI/PurR family transcriptional regulator
MSVTGFDNVQLSEFCYPALTTVDIPRERIGQIVCDSLIPTPEQPSAIEHDIVIDPELVVRDSSGPVGA